MGALITKCNYYSITYVSKRLTIYKELRYELFPCLEILMAVFFLSFCYLFSYEYTLISPCENCIVFILTIEHYVSTGVNQFDQFLLRQNSSPLSE